MDNELEAYVSEVTVQVFCICGIGNAFRLDIDRDENVTTKRHCTCHRCGETLELAVTHLRQLTTYAFWGYA